MDIAEKPDVEKNAPCTGAVKTPLLRDSAGGQMPSLVVKGEDDRHDVSSSVTSVQIFIVALDGKASVSSALCKVYGPQCIIISTMDEAISKINSSKNIGVIVFHGWESDGACVRGARELRARSGRILPIVLVGQGVSFEMMREIARMGPVDFVTGKASPDGLVSSVQNALEWFKPLPPPVQNNVLDMLAQIEERLNDLSALQSPSVDRVSFDTTLDTVPPQMKESNIDGELVKTVMKFRSSKERVLGAGIIDDAAWVMLLDLLLTYLERKLLPVTALYIGSGVPIATAMRRLNQLIDNGLAVKNPDPSDGRRMLVEITPKGVDGVCEILGQMKVAFTARSSV